MPHASIVIPSHAGASRLPILFESLSRQTMTDWEAIVVLDGDVDNSASVVGEWEARIPVRAIAFSENRGRPAALNAGFAAAGGDVLIRCDDDLELSPTHVAGHVALHATGPRGVIGLCRNIFGPTPFARAYGQQADRNLRLQAYGGRTVPWRHWAANVSVTREIAQIVGPYDENFRGYGWEDVDWGYRLHLAGIPIVIVRDLEARHHGAAQSSSARAQRAFYSGAARVRFEEKHGVAAASTAPGAWNAAVRFTGSRLTESRVTGLGRAVDRALPALPARVGEKAVAMLVESAALAGYSTTGQTVTLI